MRVPDLRQLLDAPRRVLGSHPWTAAAAALLCCVCVFLNHVAGEDPDQYLSRLAMAAGWGVSLSLLAELLSRGMGRAGRIATRLSSPIALAAWFVLVQTPMGAAQISQYALLVVATHLAVALVGGNGEDGFWHWNRALFLRLVESSLFACVLGGGAAGALVAIEKLFGLDIPWKAWGDIWIVCWSLYAPFHFLSAIPADPDRVESEHPTVLRLFSTRVLLPLAVVYLCILYVYGAKILLAWELPTGWVSAPVIAFAGFGILSQLLLAPLANDPAERWVRLWIRWFQVLLLPLTVLLGVAIGRRLLDYGLTEERYAVVVVALWLPLQAAWFLSGRRSLKAIPASLLVLALLCGWGPWGAFDASRRSQLARLDGALAALDIAPGKPHPGPVPDSLANRIGSAVDYLCDHHQGRGLERWSPAVERIRTEREGRTASRWNRSAMSDSVLKAMGVPVSRHRIGADAGERTANLSWERSKARFPPRTHVDAWGERSEDGETRFVVERDSLRWVFRLDTLVALARRYDDGEMWWRHDCDTVLVLDDSAGVATLVLRDAQLRMAPHDGNGWVLQSVNGLLLW